MGKRDELRTTLEQAKLDLMVNVPEHLSVLLKDGASARAGLTGNFLAAMLGISINQGLVCAADFNVEGAALGVGYLQYKFDGLYDLLDISRLWGTMRHDNKQITVLTSTSQFDAKGFLVDDPSAPASQAVTMPKDIEGRVRVVGMRSLMGILSVILDGTIPVYEDGLTLDEGWYTGTVNTATSTIDGTFISHKISGLFEVKAQALDKPDRRIVGVPETRPAIKEVLTHAIEAVYQDADRLTYMFYTEAVFASQPSTKARTAELEARFKQEGRLFLDNYRRLAGVIRAEVPDAAVGGEACAAVVELETQMIVRLMTTMVEYQWRPRSLGALWQYEPVAKEFGVSGHTEHRLTRQALESLGAIRVMPKMAQNRIQAMYHPQPIERVYTFVHTIEDMVQHASRAMGSELRVSNTTGA